MTQVFTSLDKKLNIYFFLGMARPGKVTGSFFLPPLVSARVSYSLASLVGSQSLTHLSPGVRRGARSALARPVHAKRSR